MFATCIAKISTRIRDYTLVALASRIPPFLLIYYANNLSTYNKHIIHIEIN
jgi:hypothetical protein